MKKQIVYLLCLMLVLSGCAGKAQGPEPPDAKPFSFDTSDFSYYVNISSEYVWDLCPFTDTQLNYMMLTKEPLESEDTVMLMFTNSCEYTAMECTDEWMTEFPFWLYQTYRGIDWDTVAEVAAAAKEGNPQAQQTLAEYETLYLEDYEALAPSDIPQLHGYWVSNNVTTVDYGTGMTAAQYETVPMSISGNDVTIDVGLLNVYRQGWDQYLASEEVDEDIYVGRLEVASPSYWGDGIVTLAPMVIAKEDFPQSLTNLELYGVEGKILDIHVSFGGKTQTWDGKSTLEIPAETAASIVVTLQTQANKTVGYCEDANFMVQRDMNGLTHRLWYFASISQSWNIYELYAMMVDGLDIAAYYEYSAQWKKSESGIQMQNNEIVFDAVTIADTSEYSMFVTGASWDHHAYSLHFSASNSSEDVLDFVLSNVYINNRNFGKEYSVNLESGENGDFTWRIAWEAMAEFGIDAQFGKDITAVEFIFDVLHNGSLPRDENGCLVINDEYSSIHPFGRDEAVDAVIPGELVLETDEVRLYAVQLGMHTYSGLSDVSRPLAYAFSFVLENFGDGSVSYYTSDFRIDGVGVEGIDASTLRGGGSCFRIVPLYVTESALTRIGEAETITFSLTLNNADTYDVVINLTTEQEG